MIETICLNRHLKKYSNTKKFVCGKILKMVESMEESTCILNILKLFDIIEVFFPIIIWI